MSRFTPKTLKKLMQIGWYQGRRVNITEMIEKAKSEQIELTENLLDFLMEFSGLCLETKDKQEILNLSQLTNYLDKQLIISAENNVEENNVLLLGLTGECNHEVEIVIAESGNVYATYLVNNSIYLLAECFDDAIEKICLHGLSTKKLLSGCKKIN